MSQSQKFKFWEKPKVENYNNFIFHDYLSKFCAGNRN